MALPPPGSITLQNSSAKQGPTNCQRHFTITSQHTGKTEEINIIQQFVFCQLNKKVYQAHLFCAKSPSFSTQNLVVTLQVTEMIFWLLNIVVCQRQNVDLGSNWVLPAKITWDILDAVEIYWKA